MIGYIAAKYSFHIKVGVVILWISGLFVYIMLQDSLPRRTYNGYIRNKIMFGYCLDINGFNELIVSECKSDKSPRWRLKNHKYLSETLTRKCVSYDLDLVPCNQASTWLYDHKNKWIVNKNTEQCLTLDYTSKTLHLWKCSPDHDFSKWNFVMQSFEMENEY